MGCHGLLGQLYLIPEYSLLRILSRSDARILSTCHLKTPFVINSFALSLPAFSLVALFLPLSCASVRKQDKLYESLSFTIVREHKLLASETSIWSRLTASNAVNRHIHHETKIDSADLQIQDVGCHELLAQHSLIHLLCL